MRNLDLWKREREAATTLNCGLHVFKKMAGENYCLLIWKPKAKNPFVNSIYSTEIKRDEALNSYAANRERHLKFKEENKIVRDKRSHEIKAILKKHFPGYKHACKIDKFSGGEAIWVHTSYLPSRDDANFDRKKYNERSQEVERLLKDYKHVSYCPYSGETLLGGNTYLRVSDL